MEANHFDFRHGQITLFIHVFNMYVINLYYRHGQIGSKELKDFDSLLSRLSQLNEVFSKPHVLEKTQEGRTLTLSDFHRNMIKYCLERNLPQLLFFYIDYWGYACYNIFR